MQKGTQMTDEQYMRRAIELAKRGMGYTSPNPMVGAVIVKDGRIIGEGWHERYGELHAERNALKHCNESPQGADSDGRPSEETGSRDGNAPHGRRTEEKTSGNQITVQQ